jgi:malonyl-CoA decarboxylase
MPEPIELQDESAVDREPTQNWGQRLNRWMGRKPAAQPLARVPISALALRRLHRELRHCFLARLTDQEAGNHARALMQRYLQSTEEERVVLLRAMALEAARFEPSAADLSELMDGERIRFFKRFNALPEGLGFLVQLRADMLREKKSIASLEPLTADLGSLFAAWFDVGFLDLRPITWDSPASLLEKLMRYEAVHQITSWNDLRNRLDSDRQCYAFFHPRLPNEPLIFVEIALLEELASDIGSLLDEGAPLENLERVKWAVFYSISNTQAGLRGVNFGHFLLKRVIDAVQERFPKLERFATLSPIPGFAQWVKTRREAEVIAIAGNRLVRHLAEIQGGPLSLAGGDVAAWLGPEDERAEIKALRRDLGERLAAHYLARGFENEQPLDGVARFHLGNGACIERINWRADRSEKGLRESFGMMVNYRYVMEDLDENLVRLKSGEPRIGRAVGRLL